MLVGTRVSVNDKALGTVVHIGKETIFVVLDFDRYVIGDKAGPHQVRIKNLVEQPDVPAIGSQIDGGTLVLTAWSARLAWIMKDGTLVDVSAAVFRR